MEQLRRMSPYESFARLAHPTHRLSYVDAALPLCCDAIVYSPTLREFCDKELDPCSVISVTHRQDVPVAQGCQELSLLPGPELVTDEFQRHLLALVKITYQPCRSLATAAERSHYQVSTIDDLRDRHVHVRQEYGYWRACDGTGGHDSYK
jgi:hypothetical protein